MVSTFGTLYLAQGALDRTAAIADARDPVRATVRAAFDQFVEVGAAAHGLFDGTWGRLGVAQLKVMSPKPGARLIGGFIQPLLFVGLRLYWRDELPFKQTGQTGRVDCRTLGGEAAADWDALLPNVGRAPMKEFVNE